MSSIWIHGGTLLWKIRRRTGRTQLSEEESDSHTTAHVSYGVEEKMMALKQRKLGLYRALMRPPRKAPENRSREKTSTSSGLGELGAAGHPFYQVCEGQQAPHNEIRLFLNPGVPYPRGDRDALLTEAAFPAHISISLSPTIISLFPGEAARAERT